MGWDSYLHEVWALTLILILTLTLTLTCTRWDSYLHEVGWGALTPHVLFSLHRSLLAGRDTDDPFKHVQVTSDAPHALRMRHEQVDNIT